MRNTKSCSSQPRCRAYNWAVAPGLTLEEASEPEGESAGQLLSLGFADLIVARERVVEYVPGEIAYIENVLPGETRKRVHTRTTETEELTEVELTETSEKEKDLQQTDKASFKQEIDKTINQDLAVNASVNVSGKYGAVEVTASASAQYSLSMNESRKSASEFAQEIVTRSVEKTARSQRELRRQRRLERVEETNEHGLQGQSAPYSAVYRWVDKIHEIELRQYGKRLMIETILPDPGYFLRELMQVDKDPLDLAPPPSFNVVADPETLEGNLPTLVKVYCAEGVQPPPALHKIVGANYSATAVDGSSGGSITIPEGYRPVRGNVLVTGGKGDDTFDMFVSVGDKVVINRYVDPDDFDGSTTSRNYGRKFLLDNCYAAEPSIPYAIRLSGLHANCGAVSIEVVTERTNEAYQRWALETWEKLYQAHSKLVEQYEDRKRRLELKQTEKAKGASPQDGGNPLQNRGREKAELKKWAISLMRRKTTHFDVLSDEGLALGRLAWARKVISFFEVALEWEQMSYFLYPYFWEDQTLAWKQKMAIRNFDDQFQQFLTAGSCRLLVPVTAGYEQRLLHYLTSPDAGTAGEESLLDWIPPHDETGREDTPPLDGLEEQLANVWTEVVKTRNRDLVTGSGTLKVVADSDLVEVNADSLWVLDPQIDVSREVFINGLRYEIMKVETDTQFQIDCPFELDSNDNANYLIGSVRFGAPWRVKLPTSLVVIASEADKLKV